MVEHAVFHNVVVAAYEHAVIAGAHDFNAIPIPVVALYLNTAVLAVEFHFAEVDNDLFAVFGLNGYVSVVFAAVDKLNALAELIGTLL